MKKHKETKEIVVSPSYILTTEHPQSSYGQAVLVKRASKEAFGTADVFEAYPSWGFNTAANHVKRMVSIKPELKDHKLVKSFLSGEPS